MAKRFGDRLSEYERKRDFKKTPEPAPGDSSAIGDGTFFLQRHDASRLHYDLRLAIGGVLKSWAVPKGPSMNPEDRRLAVQVEDHPLDYGSFEGNIPKEEYGGGSVMLWDQGTFTVEGRKAPIKQWEDGDLKLILEGEKLRGRFKLFRMKSRAKAKGDEWLFVKSADPFASAEWQIEVLDRSISTGRTQEQIAAGEQATWAKAVPPFEPMLARLHTSLPEGKSWIYEVKWDGVRALCFVENGIVDLRSRGGKSYNAAFPELSELPKRLKAKSAVLDGEIVAMDENGRIHFQAIQPRLRAIFPGTKASGEVKGISLYLFDLLARDGEDLRGWPLLKRRTELERILRQDDRVRISEPLKGRARDVIGAARENELEGIVAKKIDSRYSGGGSSAWVKVKLQRRQEFAICGWMEGKRSTFGSLVLGVFKEGKLHWAGNVGTGFSEEDLKAISAALQASSRSKKPSIAKGSWPTGMKWSELNLVAEIRYAEWTKDQRLRAPVFLGLRPDKRPEDCIREQQTDGGEEPTEQAPSKPFFSTERDSDLKSIDTPKVRLSNLKKVYFPEDGLTKGDVISYYNAIGRYLIPYLKDRPMVMKRYPDGIHGKSFFQKNLPDSTPDWVPSVEIESQSGGRTLRYLLVQDLEVLLYAVNLGCIDFHPWLSRKNHLDSPDYVLFDLDPFHCPFSAVIEAANVIHEVLTQIGLESHVKTSGGDGLHIVLPLKAGHSYEEVQEFTASMAAALSATRPDLFTTERSLSKRPKGTVYFDHVQIGRGKTIASVYSLRPRKGCPVSTPLRWDEVEASIRPEDFSCRSIMNRMEGVGDLWAPVLKGKQNLRSLARSIAKIAK